MHSESALQWLRLAMVRGIGPMLGRRLLAATGGIEALWSATACELKSVDGMGPQLLAAIGGSHHAPVADILTQCRSMQIGLICPDDPDWPMALAGVDDAPLVLFYRGNPASLQHVPMLAMVGARRASREGRLLTRRWSHYFCQHDIAIVSGMAFGIDAAAHGGALEAGGTTIAVLGCGLMTLSEEQQTQVAAIARHGCVVSEFLPAQSARPAHFPRRNRVIAALAQATLVMEADIRSGSLITARLAGKYGRDVFAVPGSVLASNHAGCHQLIRDGAMLLDRAETLLQLLGLNNDRSTEMRTGKQYRPADAAEARILMAMAGEAVHLDLLADTCGLTLPELSTILLRLELQGVIERLPGSRYLLAMELSDT